MALAPHIRGKFLLLVPGRLIVQTWRGSNWTTSEGDSVLILGLHRARRGSRLEMVHANVPDAHARSITKGWRTYYWNPWRAYFKKTKTAR
jgi:activator of HSP90 ATPase